MYVYPEIFFDTPMPETPPFIAANFCESLWAIKSSGLRKLIWPGGASHVLSSLGRPLLSEIYTSSRG